MALFHYIFNLPHISWLEVMTFFILGLMRVAPIVALAPFLGAKTAPVIVRMGLVIFITFFYLPIIVSHAQGGLGFSMTFVGYALKELLIGLFLGIFMALPFYIVQSSGIIIDYLRGASIMQSQDPSMQNQASPIGIFYNYILIVMFFAIHGPFHFFQGLATSYEIIPADRFINPIFFNLDIAFWKTSVDLINRVVAIAIQLGAPSMVAVLMAEMFLGIANRLAPQVQIAFLGMSIKSLLGLALLWAGWFFILKQFSYQANSWIDLINKMIQTFRYMLPQN